MPPPDRTPHEPTPRFGDGPPPFVPPPFVPARAAGRGGPPATPPPRPASQRSSGSAASRTQPRWSAPTRGAIGAAVLAAALAFALYSWGTAPTVLSGDSAELAAVAVRGGVPHTPGYPTFVLLGRLAAAFLHGDPAHRVALMCAFCGALSVGLFALLLSELGITWAAVFGGAIFYAGTFMLWWASIRVEVYAPATALALFALWRVFVARRTLAPGHALVAAFATGLALTGHLLFMPLLAIAGLSLALRLGQQTHVTPRLLVGCALLCALGLSPYLTLAVADHQTTLTNYLHYAIEPAGGQYGLSPAAFDSPVERLLFLLFGPESHPHDFLHHLPTATMNLGVAWLRFAAFEVGPLALLVAAGGYGALASRDAAGARMLAAIALVSSIYTALLVDGPLFVAFMESTTIAVAALAACGLDALIARAPARAPLAVALAIAAIALPHELRVRADHRPPHWLPWLRVVTKEPPIDRFFPQLRGQRAARDQAAATLAAIPESSFVAARWERVMTMKYLQSVEGVRMDLTLDPWYEPAHRMRLDRWRRAHALATHPVVVVEPIAGLIARLTRPSVVRLRDGTKLFIERRAVITR